MERNYWSNSLKDHGTRSRSYNHNNNNNNLPVSKLKDSWNHISQSYGGGGGDQDCLGGVGGFSWPPRSYTCSFCKREFRSAQALGGHMNVHRRDRARLRQSPPTMDIGQCPTNISTTALNLNLCPNNFNPNPSNSLINASPTLICTTLSSLVSSSSPLPTLSSSSPSFASPIEERKRVSNIDGTMLLDPLSPRGNSDFGQMGTRKSHFWEENLDGLKYRGGCKFFNKGEFVRLDLENGALTDHTEEELDLELRLGCS